MKKILTIVALLCASVMGWATQYCGTSLTLSGGAEIQLSCIAVSEGNYRIIIDGENLNGLGGSFFNPGAVDLRTTMTTNTSTRIVCDIASASAPSLYTPLYVLCPGEQNIGWPNDVEWADCGGSSDPGSGSGGEEPDPTPVDPNDYTAGGHTIHLEAYYVNDIYTLNITSTDAMEGLGGSFWNVNGVGADMRTNTGTSSYTVSGDKKTITCQVQSTSAPNIYTPLYVLMPGEINFGNVTLNWEDRTPIASEYCGQAMSSGNTLAKFTWETTAEGNVNITIIEALGGAANASYFRGHGITANKIKIGEGREDITTYFTHPGDIAGQSTLTLTLTDPANTPAPGTKIYVEDQIIEYATSKDGNAWPTLSFEYTYGGVCAEEKVLTEISLTASSTFALVGDAVTLTAQGLDQMGMPIDAEISFAVSPANAGNLSDNTFTFAKTGAATITASSGEVQKSITLYGVPSANLALNKESEGGYYDNNPAEGYDKANDGNEGTAWVTYADQSTSKEWWFVDLGDTYSLTAVDVVWGNPSSTSYKIFARTEAPLEDDKADDSAWEEIASVSGIGINSEQFNEVSVNARYVRIHSLSRSGNCIRLKEVRIFGTEYVPVEDTQKPVMTSASKASCTYTEAVINVAATDNVGVYRFHVVDGGNNIDVNLAADEGKITINNLTHATDYNFTITAKDAAGNESDNNFVVPVTTPFDGSINLALNQPCEGGYYDNNPAESADKANDGNNGTSWVTYGDHAAALDWWVVDLGKVYSLTNITALWANDAYATNYMLQARVEDPSDEDKADDAAWVTLATVSGVTAGEEKSTDVSGVGRYVRFRATAKAGGFFRLREFRVYASGVATVDTEKPAMSFASLVSNTDVQAVIAVAATDNQGVAKYHVVDAGNSFGGDFVAENGNITVTGLTGGTNYTLVITAVDYFGNESANSKSVEVTTTAHYTEPQAACPAPTWDAELVKAMYSPTYNADYTHQDWGSGTVATKDEFGRKYVTNANGYFGADGFALNCLMMEKLHYDIWIADDATVRFVPIWGGTEQGKTINLTGQQWNSIDINLTDYTTVTNWGNITQMKIDNAKNLTFWVANAYFYRETAIADGEVPTNVSASLATTGFYSVQITAQAEDNSGAVNFKVMDGQNILATAASATATATTITVNNLTPGTTYHLKVVAYDDAENEAAPKTLTVKTNVLPSPAPVPAIRSENIKALYSNAYTPAVSLNDKNQNWYNAPRMTELTLGENDDALLYDNLPNPSTFGWAFASLDATGYQKLHVSIYPMKSGTIEFYPVIAPEGEFHSVSQNLEAEKWNEVIIDYSDKTFAAFTQLGFTNYSGLGAFIIDNVYFFKTDEISITTADLTMDDLNALNGAIADVDIDRPMTADTYFKTLCLPFAMNAEQIAETFGDCELLRLKEAHMKSETDMYVGYERVNTIEAGYPYLITLFGSENLSKLDFSGVTINSATTNNTITVDAGDGKSVEMVGTFVSITRSANEDFYLDAADNLLHSIGEYCSENSVASLTIPAFRCYFRLIGFSNPSSVSARVMHWTEVATYLEKTAESETSMRIEKLMRDGQLFIIRDGKMYTVTGLKVE